MTENISKFTFRMLTQSRKSLEKMATLAKGEGSKEKDSLNKLVNHAINVFVNEIEEIKTPDDLIKAQELINAKIEAYLKQSHLMNIRLAKLLKQNKRKK